MIDNIGIPLSGIDMANVINVNVLRVKIMLSGEVTRAVTIGKGIGATKGARSAIEAAGGKFEE